ncbi:hypothetical protein VJ923_06115 [Adlercreutzia sp. R25]|uniref:Uncharacterized protein n=1 Tax=Adlercreutzia shanghongiae TaxID=3111773 RepID=A0ABU6IX25_9ACTN|nr:MULTISPECIES: hypothetical protein [unclassified Adlercreutzia]MEC4272727.1 hypothetical protein [Adlercreutzia sp. R25]MEC4294374.1 hypothetical protein [Adlercreutzia sp. R22]
MATNFEKSMATPEGAALVIEAFVDAYVMALQEKADKEYPLAGLKMSVVSVGSEALKWLKSEAAG